MSRGRLPNAITLGRILLSPVFILFFIRGGDYYFAAFVVGLLFELTDFLDGALARHSNQVTGFGKIFDPLADSISRSLMGFTARVRSLTANGMMPTSNRAM